MSEFDPLDVSLGARRPKDDRFKPEAPRLPPSSPGARKAEDEDLPPSYRPRADPHHSDQMTPRRMDRPPSEAPRTPVPNEGARVLSLVAQHVATIEAAARMLAADSSPLARRVGIDLIRAQAFRGAWLARASLMLDCTHRGQVRPSEIGAMLVQVRDAFSPECRLAGVTMEIQASEWGAVASTDAQSVMTAVEGAIFATLALAGETGGLKVKVSVVAAGGELRQIDVTQEEVTVGASVAARFFNPTWTERPGGWLTDVAASTVRMVAERHGGQAILLASRGRGSTIRLTLARPSPN